MHLGIFQIFKKIQQKSIINQTSGNNIIILHFKNRGFKSQVQES